ncbi:MAG: LysR family transcriptional regulator [Anaerovoracaceae bacterium]|jgi:DNA-binding transcriptional LysR family regulator
MDLNKYQVLIEVVDRGGFNQACDALGYTRSALSKMMNSLEDEVGFSLITRTNRGVRLTPEGQRVLPRIRKLLLMNEALEEQFSQICGIERGKVRIGSFPTICASWLPDVVSAFHLKYPKLEIEITEENSFEELETWLRQGIIDVAIFSRQDYHEFEWILEEDEPFVVLMREDHPLAEKERLTEEDLQESQLIMYKFLGKYDSDVTRFLKLLHYEKKVFFESNSVMAINRILESSDLIALQPLGIARRTCSANHLTYREVDVEGLIRHIGMAVRSKKELSPSVRKFTEFCNENLSLIESGDRP